MNPKIAQRIIFVFFLSTIVGCNSYTGTVSREPAAFIQLDGVTESHVAIVDELSPVRLVPKRGQARLKVEPGKRRVRILLDQLLLVDRTILISDLQTFEVSVPNP